MIKLGLATTIVGLFGAVTLSGCANGGPPAGGATTTAITSTSPATVAPLSSTADSSVAAPTASPPTSSPSRSTPAPASSSSGATGSTVGPGQVVNVAQNATRWSGTCQGGGEIDIRASRVHLTATGQCAEIDIQGDANVVILDQASRIQIVGSGNDVAYRTGTPSVQQVGGTNNVHRLTPARTTSPSVVGGGVLTVSGSSQVKTFACNNRSVRLEGDSNLLTITGNCVSITVTGDSNQVTVGSVDAVRVKGTSNRIIYHSGHPTVTRSGFANSVEHG